MAVLEVKATRVTVECPEGHKRSSRSLLANSGGSVLRVTGSKRELRSQVTMAAQGETATRRRVV